MLRTFRSLALLQMIIISSYTTVRAQYPVTDSRRNAITRAVEIVSPAVVGINVIEVRQYRDPFFNDPMFRYFFGDRTYTQNVQSLGSGFIVSEDGYILTNDHVAGNASKIVVTMTNGEKLDAQLIGTDPVSDIALIKIDGNNLPSLQLGNSDNVIVGEWAIAFGNPFGLFAVSAKPTVTVGVISATHMLLSQQEGRVYRNMIQTDAAINSGNSGGPLVNGLGEVIGINTVIYTPNQGSIGLGFAIPVNKVKEIMQILKERGAIKRNFISGFHVQVVTPVIAKYYKLKKSEGVVVADISRGGCAERSGLSAGDVIVEADGEHINSAETLESIIRYAKNGDVIQLKVVRDNELSNISLLLDAK